MLRKIAVILSMLITVFVGFGLIIPVFPLMIQNVGAKPYHIGLMLSVYSAVGFFLSPWWGRLSDRIGRRPILITGLFGFSVSFLVFGFAAHSLWLMYVARLIGGGFSGAVTAVAMAYIADVTGVQDRTKGMAFAGMAIGMGFILGPAMGGMLSTFGLPVPFFVAAGLAFANAIWGLIALKESHEAPSGELSNRSRWEAFRGALKFLYMVDFVSQFSISALEGVFQIYEVHKIHASAFQVGLMFFASGIVGAVVQGGIIQRYVKHGREVPAMNAGLFVSAIGMVLILFSKNFWTATLFMTLFGASNTVIKPVLTSVITKETKVGQGLASGLISSMDSLARIVGPLLATLLYEVKFELPFVVTAVIIFSGLLMVSAYHRNARHERVAAEAM